MGVQWHFTVVLSVFLWVLMMSSFFSCVNWPLAYLLWWKVYTTLLAIFFFNWVIVFLLLNRKTSLFILDTIPLSDLWVANIFPQSVVSLCLLNGIFRRSNIFNFNEVEFITFYSFTLHVFLFSYVLACLVCVCAHARMLTWLYKQFLAQRYRTTVTYSTL